MLFPFSALCLTAQLVLIYDHRLQNEPLVPDCVRLVRACFFLKKNFFLCLMFMLFKYFFEAYFSYLFIYFWFHLEVSMASALVPIILSSCSPGLYQGQFTKTRMQNKNPKVDSPLTWSGLVCYQKEFDNCFGANCPSRLLHLV